MDTALLVARIFFGLGIAAHGAQKLFGWFSGGGINKTGEFMVMLGWTRGQLFATAAGLGEFGGGVLVALGLLNPIGPAVMILVMIVAILSVHVRKGFFVGKNGVELPGLYTMGAFLLAFTGPGRYSLDSLFGLQSLSTTRNAWIAVGTAVIVALLNIAIRRPPSAAKG